MIYVVHIIILLIVGIYPRSCYSFINKMYNNSVGPPHLLTHQLLDNAVILRWSPPLMDYIQFQYNITVAAVVFTVLITIVTSYFTSIHSVSSETPSFIHSM